MWLSSSEGKVDGALGLERPNGLAGNSIYRLRSSINYLSKFFDYHLLLLCRLVWCVGKPKHLFLNDHLLLPVTFAETPIRVSVFGS